MGSGSRPASGGQTLPHRGGSLGGVGGKSRGKGFETTTVTSPAAASSQYSRGPFAHHESDGVRYLASGGLVDPAELWLWTEDERDHGERQNRDGLLSRGGGAHVSRMAATAVLGAFASSQQGPFRAATTTPEKENAGGTPTSTVESHGTEAGKEASVGCLPEPNKAGSDENSTASAPATPESEVNARTPLRGATPLGGLLAAGIGGSPAALRGPPTKCEWCGAVVVVGGEASHSAAFCDEEVVCVQKFR